MKFNRDTARKCLLAARDSLLTLYRRGEANPLSLDDDDRWGLQLFLQAVDFSNLFLSGADLRGANLEGAVLPKVHLERSVLTWGASLCGAYLDGARLEQSDMSGLQAIGVTLNGATLQHSNLNDSQLWFSDFTRANIREVNLDNAELQGSCLASAVFAGSNLRRTRLDGADLSDADLRGTTLSGAKLHGANLQNAQLGSSDFGIVHPEVRTSSDDPRRRPLAESRGEEAADFLGCDQHHEKLRELRKFDPSFPSYLGPADLRNASFDDETRLDSVTLSNPQHGSARTADINWNDVNLSVINWRDALASGDGLRAALGLGNRSQKPGFRSGELVEEWVRSNRLLAAILASQGLSEIADHYAYRAQVAQRRMYKQEGQAGRWIFSLFLALIAGYGYRPIRAVFCYFAVISLFWILYLIEAPDRHAISPLGALILSIASFHGRGLFPNGVALDSAIVVTAACQAVVGLVVEATFIATFAQRFLAAR